ncbi:50S ribosomal protein L25 [Dissulfurimicrobium hydrothermale]|uniref:50S ribosomal protein L25 n=1 Tax=Dissulfurimicrobium hydrothermale TaxID=1750598 RepID=UPI001EDA3800|nr:50S ribosomal protein L25 [Dissulfurimicrobium hydrothermale]UKL14435.1 50S ribosomal protein L25 [Dissulfurimicrobium hydrothermale]
MKQVTLDALMRDETGKGAARKLRGAGRLPGVLYGPKNKSVPLSVDAHRFNRIIETSKGEQILFSLNLRGAGGDEASRLALVKELQLHPVNERIRHIDFYEVYMNEEVRVDVPIAITGKARGVEIENGILEIIKRTVKVSCLPMSIPKEILVDVSDLGLGEAIHAADLVAPAGVRIMEDPKTAFITIVGAGIEEKASETTEAEAAAETTTTTQTENK